MLHKGTQTLETQRLILRKFTPDDAYNMFNNWASSERVTKFMTWQPYNSVEDVRDYITYIVSGYKNPDNYSWIIELKETHQAIGNIDVVRLCDDTNEMEVGYCLSDKYWHKGLMTEALNRLIDFLFTEIKVNRIMATHDVNNPNSGGVMKKCGLKYEGTHRQAGKNNTGICDTAVYAILLNEYIKQA